MDTNRSRTYTLFSSICKVLYIIGVGNFWPKHYAYMKLRKLYSAFYAIFILVMIVMEITGLFAENMDKKQKFDNLIFVLAHPIYYFYYVFVSFNEGEIRELVIKQCITLPKLYENEVVETEMIKNVKMYSFFYLFSTYTALVFFGIAALTNVVKNGGPFVVIVSYWPKTDDPSTTAESMRVFLYLLWYLMMSNTLGVLVLVLSQTICLAHRFKHLCHYFVELTSVFEENLTQNEKETKFQRKFINGMRMHAETLWCVKKLQNFLGAIYSGQTFLNVSLVVLIMVRALTSERISVEFGVAFLTLLSVLFISGAFMWTAGNVNAEASRIPEAMFHSGWHNCCFSMKKIQCLLVVSISQGQVPVIIKAFGIIPMSYMTYVSILKTSYSIFTIMY